MNLEIGLLNMSGNPNYQDFRPGDAVTVQYPYSDNDVEHKQRQPIIISIDKKNKLVLTVKTSTSEGQTRFDGNMKLPQKYQLLTTKRNIIITQPTTVKYIDQKGNNKKGVLQLKNNPVKTYIRDTNALLNKLQTFRFDEILNVPYYIETLMFNKILNKIKNYLKEGLINLSDTSKINKPNVVPREIDVIEEVKNMNNVLMNHKIELLTEQQLNCLFNFMSIDKKIIKESDTLFNDINTLSIDEYSNMILEQYADEETHNMIKENDKNYEIFLRIKENESKKI